MKELGKWCWMIFLPLLTLGWWFFVIMAVEVVAFVLVLWLRPEWLEDYYWKLPRAERKACRQLPKSKRHDFIWEKAIQYKLVK